MTKETKPKIFRHKGFTIKQKKEYRSPVLMYKEGVLNPDYKSKLVSYVFTKEDKDGK
jgi:hypothetical protein